MWKKEDEPTKPTNTPSSRPQAHGRESNERAKIGRSITIEGKVTGDEDLLIEGRVNGSVTLEQNAVTVGSGGEVKASISGRVVTVEGKVVGDLVGEEQVLLRGTADVEGDIKAPRVVIEDGARFRGGVDMGEKETSRTSSQASSLATSSSSASDRTTKAEDASKKLEEPSKATSEPPQTSVGKNSPARVGSGA